MDAVKMCRLLETYSRVVFFCAILCASIFINTNAFASQRVYTIGVVPQFTPLTIHRSWGPFIDRLSQETGIKFRLRVYPNFKQFLSDVRRGEPDFVFLAPFHAVIAHKEQGYVPLIRDDANKLVGLLVVRKDSPITSVNALDGKRISFPSPNAFAASIYMRAYLSEKEDIKFIPRYVGTHDNVYRHVLVKLSAAGGGVNKTLIRQPVNLRDKLRVLYQLPGVAAHPISAHPRVPKTIQEKFVTTIMDLHASNIEKSLLTKVQLRRPIRADYNRDYQFLEDLNLEKYMN